MFFMLLVLSTEQRVIWLKGYKLDSDCQLIKGALSLLLQRPLGTRPPLGKVQYSLSMTDPLLLYHILPSFGLINVLSEPDS